jgi:large subunit ribosomal protein L22
VKSAVANAENNNAMAADDLRIVEAIADDGRKLKRFKPQSRGRMSPILKRSCHLIIAVDEEEAEGGT